MLGNDQVYCIQEEKWNNSDKLFKSEKIFIALKQEIWKALDSALIQNYVQGLFSQTR